jgi:hypothetical protein
MSSRRVRARGGTGAQHQAELEGVNDARTGMPHGIPRGAMCVQRFDDSLNSAIHTTYRISLRSSSMPEPRDPLLKVVNNFGLFQFDSIAKRLRGSLRRETRRGSNKGAHSQGHSQGLSAPTAWRPCRGGPRPGNDPSAGSPTETLLRLLLPLNDRV